MIELHLFITESDFVNTPHNYDIYLLSDAIDSEIGQFPKNMFAFPNANDTAIDTQTYSSDGNYGWYVHSGGLAEGQADGITKIPALVAIDTTTNKVLGIFEGTGKTRGDMSDFLKTIVAVQTPAISSDNKYLLPIVGGLLISVFLLFKKK